MRSTSVGASLVVVGLLTVLGALAMAVPAAGGILVTRMSQAVMVGISHYEDTKIASINFGAADAKSVYEVLTSAPAGSFAPRNARLLTDGSPTKDLPTRSNILSALANMANPPAGPLPTLGEPDTLLFYFSGQSTEEGLVPCDAGLSHLEDSLIPFAQVNQIVAKSPAKHKVLIYDCSYAASAFDTVPRAGRNWESFFVLTAAERGQGANEFPALGHGIFTASLLAGLKGGADLNGDGGLTVFEVVDYVTREMGRGTRERGVVQVPAFMAVSFGEYELLRLRKGEAR